MNSREKTYIAAALRGELIYGDDFSTSEIEQWYADEIEGYASLGHEDSKTEFYAYHALDRRYVWRHLVGTGFRVLGLGSAFGSEFKPIADRIHSLTVIEPNQSYWRTAIQSVPVSYICPKPDGQLSFNDEHFDLITAFGVLHHIPNVSAVLGELSRVLKRGGLMAIREPIVSMGDWRFPRPGLTKRERGIPFFCMRSLLEHNGLTILAQHAIGFGPLLKIASKLLARYPWNIDTFVAIDFVTSRLFSSNLTYHRTTLLSRFAPTIGVWVVKKRVR